MSEKTAIVPIEQKEVLFYEDEITAVRLEDGRIMIPLRPICETLGLAWSSQLQRVRRDAVLKSELVSVFVTNTESQRGGREVQCLPLDMLHGFLFGVNASRARAEIREKLIRYQRECYRILYEAFQDGRLTADATSIDDLLKTNSDAAEAYRMAAAIMKLARHQLMLEVTQQQHGSRLEDHETRLEELESAIGPGTAVSEDQASQISQAVKAVAIAMGKQTKRNEFGAIYGELYRKFGITSYKMLPSDRFDEAMSFLGEWFKNLEGDTPF